MFLSIPSQIPLFDDGSASSVNARTLPYLISFAIILLSLIIIASNILNERRGEANSLTKQPAESTSYGRVFLTFIAIALWVALMPYLGFNIATILLIASIMLIIGKCAWWQIMILSLILSFPVNYLLALVLRVYLPSGSLFG